MQYQSIKICCIKNIKYGLYRNNSKNFIKIYFKSVDTVNKGDFISKIIVSVVGTHSNIGQLRIIKTSGLTMKIVKTEDLTNNQTIYEGLAKMMIPSFCELIQNKDCFKNFENITLTVNSKNLIFELI